MTRQALSEEVANVWIRSRRDNFTGLLDSLADKQALKGVRNPMTQICTMKCPHCGSTAIKAKPEQQFKCDGCGWRL
jgi:transposase-like protein